METYPTGTLASTEFCSLYRQLHDAQETGILELMTKKDSYLLHFKNGVLTGIEKENVDLEHEVMTLIEENNVVSEDKLNIAREKQTKMIRTCSEILIDEGFMPMMLYSRIISGIVRLWLLELLFEPKLTYTYMVKDTINQDHSIKPVSYERFQLFYNKFEQYRKFIRKLYVNRSRNIEVVDRTTHVRNGKNIIQNYLTTEYDLLEYFVLVASYVQNKKCHIENPINAHTVGVLIFGVFVRSIVLVLTLIFIYSCFLIFPKAPSKRYDAQKKEFLIHKALILKSLFYIDTGKEGDVEMLRLNGYLNESEAKIISDKKLF